MALGERRDSPLRERHCQPTVHDGQVRTAQRGYLVVALAVTGITLSACGTYESTSAMPASASSRVAATSLPPSTNPAPWADASTTVPTVTTTTISVVSPFTADAVAPLGSDITL